MSLGGFGFGGLSFEWSTVLYHTSGNTNYYFLFHKNPRRIGFARNLFATYRKVASNLFPGQSWCGRTEYQTRTRAAKRNELVDGAKAKVWSRASANADHVPAWTTSVGRGVACWANVTAVNLAVKPLAFHMSNTIIWFIDCKND